MCFLSLTLTYIMRFCLSIAITEMVANRQRGKDFHIDPNACPFTTSNTTNASVNVDGEFHWSEETQGIILSSFFWGYVITQMPGGLLSEKVGGKIVLGFGILVSSLGTLLTPIAARLGDSIGLIITRICIGLGQGVIYPSLHVVTAHWIPTEERGLLGCFVFAGVNFGNAVSMSLSGFLLGLYKGGWPLVFYLYGTCGILWVVAWYFLGYSSPNDHPNLSEKEKKYLNQYNESVNMNKVAEPTPWREILKSVPMWGLVIGQIGHDWGLFTVVTDLPKYMKSVMHFSITQNGLLLALPYLLMWAVGLTSGAFSDWLLKRHVITITTSRKIFTTIASVGPSLGILGATYSGCDRIAATIFFIIGMGFMGFFYPSLKVNALDLSPNYAGTISAFVIGIGAISGIITPYLVGLLTPENTLLQWRLVFWIAVVALVGTNMIYIFTGSGEVQKWNNPQKKEDKDRR
ncbi:hypothetical protein AAG570_013579 [Ranatra chinensis]|uniref:Major facilitator superfamily (MFS) profile domain-containing protein n=1 Tax=Ranatra chinensis TaxID=642074 RepID=A0ABD0YCT7_9HEMI